ncbi:hypothetical protein ACFLQ6_06765 [Thermoproteota archaeon]
MNKFLKIIFFGILAWLIPFLISVLFVDMEGNFIIPQTFFKSIMIVVGSLVAVVLAVKYYKNIKNGFVKEGIILGIIWFIISIALDLVMVFSNFFQMTVLEYFTDIGLRYLCIPIFTIGLGYALNQKKSF